MNDTCFTETGRLILMCLFTETVSVNRHIRISLLIKCWLSINRSVKQIKLSVNDLCIKSVYYIKISFYKIIK